MKKLHLEELTSYQERSTHLKLYNLYGGNKSVSDDTCSSNDQSQSNDTSFNTDNSSTGDSSVDHDNSQIGLDQDSVNNDNM